MGVFSKIIKLKNIALEKLKTNSSIAPIAFEFKNERYEIGYRSKYVYNGVSYKVAPKEGDVVVEAGVYKGRDTASFAKIAEKVVGFEPSLRNYKKAVKNVGHFDNVSLINEGLWKEEDELRILQNESSGDDGFLEPDGDSATGGEYVRVNKLKNYLEEMKIEEVNFLKIEVEGAEPEVIKGMGNIRPRNVVINAGEERSKKPTGKKVTKKLQKMGYNLVAVKMGHILFFTQEDVSHCAFR